MILTILKQDLKSNQAAVKRFQKVNATAMMVNYTKMISDQTKAIKLIKEGHDALEVYRDYQMGNLK